MPPETNYARSGDVHIAYQIAGTGPLDLIFVMGWVSHLDYFWAEPRFARFLDRLSSFSRLILFDKRGTGLSDRVSDMPTLEQRMDDVRAVMDAVGSSRAALFGISEGAAMCALFAATYPERTSALVIYGGYAKRLWDPTYPWAPTEAERQKFFDAIEHGWGGVVDLESLAPTLADNEPFRHWWAAYLRHSASPGAALALARMNTQIDIRPVLPAISVPTLVLHRSGDLDIDVGGARYLARRIPGARYVELEGDDHLFIAGDQDAILAEVEEFLTGTLATHESDRVLATLLLTSIDMAAAMAVQLGDDAWHALMRLHDEMESEQIARYRGMRVGRTSSGTIATFDGPARAIACAQTIVERGDALGLAIKAGVHAGECDIRGGALSGAAVHIAERVLNRARPREVLASNTVKDLVAGSGIMFERTDARLLTNTDDSWQLYRVVSGSPTTVSSEIAQSEDARAGRTRAVLTAREREVATLVADGATNRAIAETLSISPATVERHIANILGKLGFHSRAQVASWVVRHELGGAPPN